MICTYLKAYVICYSNRYVCIDLLFYYYMEEEMDYTSKLNKRMVQRFVKKYLFWILLLSVIVGGLCSYSVFRTQDKEYTTSGLFVQNDNNYAIISSYNQFVHTGKFKTLVNKQTSKKKWSRDLDQYKYEFSITAKSNNSPFFSLNVESNNSEYARHLGNIATKVFKTNIKKYLSSANVSLVTNPSKVSAGNNMTNIVKAGIAGFLITAVIIFIVDCFIFIKFGKLPDNNYIQDVYQIKLLGVWNANQ